MIELEVELRLLGVLAAMLLLPGGALLQLSGAWRDWSNLQRTILSIGLSIALFPALFYGARVALPFLALNSTILWLLLAASGLYLLWSVRQRARPWLRLDALEWCAIFIFALTVASRLWIAYAQPYPAWTDSLHHVILTQLTATEGRLATTLQPYFPIDLDMYHLGLYALAASAQKLSGAPPHMALHWTAQLLNGLCGLGVYLALDRLVGRTGALVGAATVGLFLHQPAFYVNWGRFTQVAAQSILLIGWVATVETVRGWSAAPAGERLATGPRIWCAVLSGLLTAGIFLLHFRVALFYLPLLMVTIVSLLWQAHRVRRLDAALMGTVAVGLASLLFVLPVLWSALRAYLALQAQLPEQTLVSPEELAEIVRNYYVTPLSSIPYLAAPPLALGAGVVLGLVGLLRRNWVSAMSLLWTVLLILLGYAYLLEIPQLRLTNLGAILIMLYLPLGLLIGAGVEALLGLMPRRYRPATQLVLLGALLVAILPAAGARASTLEPFRFFVTPADVAAMQWIDANVPEDAQFAVNTVFWLPNAPHGTDAGYWIPYFTGRGTTASAMPLNAASLEYQAEILEVSHAAQTLENDLSGLDTLRAHGVEYVYIGQRGDYAEPGLQVDHLTQSGQFELLYNRDGVTILRIRPAE